MTRHYSVCIAGIARWKVDRQRDSGVGTNVKRGQWQKASELKGHSGWVRAVDVSPGSTQIASGSGGKTVYMCRHQLASDCSVHGNVTTTATITVHC